MSIIPQDKGKPSPAVRAVLKLWRESGRRGLIRISGNSMCPLLCNGRKAVVEPRAKEIKWGDIAVYRQANNLIIHRIVKVKRRDDYRLFQTKGDNTLNFDSFLMKESQIIGKVIALVRGKTIVNLESGWWRTSGRLLALYSYLVGWVVGRIQFWVKLFFKNGENSFVSFGGKILLSAFSILPRMACSLFQPKFRDH